MFLLWKLYQMYSIAYILKYLVSFSKIFKSALYTIYIHHIFYICTLNLVNKISKFWGMFNSCDIKSCVLLINILEHSKKWSNIFVNALYLSWEYKFTFL